MPSAKGLTALSLSRGALHSGQAPGSSSNGAPNPHFDSILRAAPAYDADNLDDDDENNDGDGDSHSVHSSSGSTRLTSMQTSPTVAVAVRPHLAQHTSLHAYLDANMMIQEMILGTREKIHEDTGRLKSRQRELSRSAEKLKEAEAEKDKATAFLWTPKRRRRHRQNIEKARLAHKETNTIVHDLDRDLNEDKQRLASLELELAQYKRTEARLDALDNHIFSGSTPDHPEEDEMEQKYHILLQTAQRLQAAVQLEKRALNHLNKAHTLCQAMLKELLKGLDIGIQIGVPTNTKHKTQLWHGTSPMYTARASRGLILRSKTICGDLHTHYISARAIQRRVSQLPSLEVIELTRLPDMRGKNTLDEVGLHRALENSYAQGKIAKAHIVMEIGKSKRRQRSLRDHIRGLEGEARSVWLHLRSTRRAIIDGVRRNEPPIPSPPADMAGESPSDEIADLMRPSAASAALQVAAPQHSPSLASPASIPGSAEASQRPSMSSTLPPPYRRDLASQSTLGIAFPPATSTPAGTLADLAATNDWEAREQHRLLSLPHAFRHHIERESLKRSRAVLARVAVEVGGVVDDDDLDGVGEVEVDEDADPPGLHLSFGQ